MASKLIIRAGSIILVNSTTLGAHFTEVNGHVEQCDKEDSDKTVHEFASEKFKLLREGYAYREVCTEADLSLDKLFNKSVLLSKVLRCRGIVTNLNLCTNPLIQKSTTKPSPGETEVYRSTNLNAHLLLLHKFNKLPEQSMGILYSCTRPLDRFTPFIHTSGRKSKVSGRRILFCEFISRAPQCSILIYNIYVAQSLVQLNKSTSTERACNVRYTSNIMCIFMLQSVNSVVLSAAVVPVVF